MCVIGKERKGESAVFYSDNENPDSEPMVCLQKVMVMLNKNMLLLIHVFCNINHKDNWLIALLLLPKLM